MFYVFCDMAVSAAIIGIVLSIAADVIKMKKKNNRKIAKASDIFGVGFIACTVATTLCFFAGF